MNEMHTDIIRPEGLAIPDETTQEQWEALHRHILLAKRAAGKWLSQSRSWASQRWGIDYVAETEVQMELALGIESKETKPTLNAGDKSKAIVTIEGIAQSFSMWHRKMASEVETWEADRLSRALELLEPMEQQAQAIRARLNDLRV
jgi:hypothetical protein